jgi:hypothetical protein
VDGVVAEAQALHDAGSEVLQEHVAPLEQGREDLLGRGFLRLRLSASGRSFMDVRAGSPSSGSSTLITSAPSQASIWPHDGHAWLLVTSTTRIPASAPLGRDPLSPEQGARATGDQPIRRRGLGDHQA